MQRVVGAGEFGGAFDDATFKFVAGLAQFLFGLVAFLDHVGEGGGQLSDFVVARQRHGQAVAAGGEFEGDLSELAQRPRDGAAHEKDEEQRHGGAAARGENDLMGRAKGAGRQFMVEGGVFEDDGSEGLAGV